MDAGDETGTEATCLELTHRQHSGFRNKVHVAKVPEVMGLVSDGACCGSLCSVHAHQPESIVMAKCACTLLNALLRTGPLTLYRRASAISNKSGFAIRGVKGFKSQVKL